MGDRKDCVAFEGHKQGRQGQRDIRRETERGNDVSFPHLRRGIERLGEKGTNCAAFEEEFIEADSGLGSFGRRRVINSSATKGLVEEDTIDIG